MRRVLVLVAALTLMVGCGGEDPPEQGDVINKEYTPAHWESGYRTEHYQDCGLHQNIDGDLEFGCEPATRQVWEPHHEHVQDRWRLRLRDCTTDDKGERKCREGWLSVDETTYHDYKTGSHFPNPE